MGRPLPRIVCVCDEYADLVSRGRQERRAVEERIVRLGQKARASGIHLILATQQPSREIITGALDSNMPCRVGLKMQKAMESRCCSRRAARRTCWARATSFPRHRRTAPSAGPLGPQEIRAKLFSGSTGRRPAGPVSELRPEPVYWQVR